MRPPRPALTLFPYTTLFRSIVNPSSKTDQEDFRIYASEISRLGSGSACRSFYPEAAIWGQSSFSGTSDRYAIDRKSTRLNSSHVAISYAVFCLNIKNQEYKF